jgi:hypothetical protein
MIIPIVDFTKAKGKVALDARWDGMIAVPKLA